MAMHVAGVAAKILRISYNCRPSNVDPGDNYRAALIKYKPNMLPRLVAAGTPYEGPGLGS
jgi:hypothetical protein